MGNSNALYLGINVYRRLRSDEAAVYRCFKKLPDGGYCVQSADRVRLPFKDENSRFQKEQFWELLIEEAPDARSRPFPTIEEAIADFDAAFEE